MICGGPKGHPCVPSSTLQLLFPVLRCFRFTPPWLPQTPSMQSTLLCLHRHFAPSLLPSPFFFFFSLLQKIFSCSAFEFLLISPIREKILCCSDLSNKPFEFYICILMSTLRQGPRPCLRPCDRNWMKKCTGKRLSISMGIPPSLVILIDRVENANCCTIHATPHGAINIAPRLWS